LILSMLQEVAPEERAMWGSGSVADFGLTAEG